MKAYLIRCSNGILTDKVFAAPPSRADLEDALGKCLVQYGHRKGEVREMFATYVEVEMQRGEPREEDSPLRVSAILTEDELLEILLAQILENPGEVHTGAESMQFEGTGMVINPDDPRHPRYQK